MAITEEDTLRAIDEAILDYKWDNQPLYIDLMNGNVNIEQLKEFSRHFGVFALHNHNYHGRLYVNCPDPDWREKIAEVVYEEGTGRMYANGVRHNELWLQFGESIGLTRDEMWSVVFCPGALALRVYFEWICGQTFLEGVAAHMLAGEAQVTGVFNRVAASLKENFDLSDKDVAFYTVHDVADDDHSGVGRELLGKFATTDDDHRLVVKTVKDYLGIEDLMYQDVYRRMQALA